MVELLLGPINIPDGDQDFAYFYEPAFMKSHRLMTRSFVACIPSAANSTS